MDYQIKPVHNKDIIRSKIDGTWTYRHDVDPSGQPPEYMVHLEVLPHGTQEWQQLRKSEDDAFELTGGSPT